MRRIVHVSDLHFGRDTPALVTPLRDAINALSPDVMVISGDLTQRATAVQFRAAAAFIASLRSPVLSVPGNHDVPLHNLVLRLLLPWRRYRRWIGIDLEPEFSDDEVVVRLCCMNPSEAEFPFSVEMAGSRPRNGRYEFSAQLFAQCPISRSSLRPRSSEQHRLTEADRRR